jgi:hypothetical protein
LKLFSITDRGNDEEKESAQMTKIYSMERVNSLTPTDAVTVAYDSARTKLNLLSLISNKGFLISHIWPLYSKDAQSIMGSTEQMNQEIGATRKWLEYSKKPEIKSVNFSSGKITKDPEYLQEGFHTVIYPQEEPTAVRNIVLLKISDLENDWSEAFDKFSEKDVSTHFLLNQAMELYRISLTSRELYSRYLLDWIALDSITPFVEKQGSKKIAGMSRFIGRISGIDDLGPVIEELYRIRNDIAHSRMQQILEFNTECKKGLLWLEWILTNLVRTKIGLNQRNEKAAPNIKLEID